MCKKTKNELLIKLIVVIFIGLLILILGGRTYSRYYDSVINNRDLLLAPWNITINNQKVHSAGEIDVIVDLVITETTTITKTYKNKLVPGCKGYFDIEINPSGTGVAIDYIIDFNPDNLPGGMKYTKYDTLDENKSVIISHDSFPSGSKLIGTMPIIDGNLLGPENILRYRIYFEYVDDDSLNITAPSVNNQNSVMVNVILEQSM